MRKFSRILIALVVVLLLLSLMMPLVGPGSRGAALVSALPMGLGLGWMSHLTGTFPNATMNASWLASIVCLLGITTWALHRLMLRFVSADKEKHTRWRLRHSISLMVLVLCTFATASAAVGVIHHSLWLLKGPTYREAGSGWWRAQSNGSQLATALRSYSADHDGDYPASLDALVPKVILEEERLARLVRIEVFGEVEGRWIYLPGLRDDVSGGLPLLVASVPTSSGKHAVMMNDSSRVTEDPQALAVLLEKWRQHVGASRLPLGLELKP